MSSPAKTFPGDDQLAAAASAPADVALLSVDGMIFNVHKWVLLRASSNAFGGLLATAYTGIPIPAEDDSVTLQAAVSAAYGLDNAPPEQWPQLTRTVSALHFRYGIPLPAPGSQLFNALRAHAFLPGGAPDVYAFAAQHKYEALAVAASEHMLSISLPDLPAAWTEAVGAVYMRRLFFLHLGRVDALKRILAAPPALHAPETACGAQDMQEHTLRPWARAIADLVFDARADTPPDNLAAKLNPVAYRTPCAKCALAVRQRVEGMVRDWSAVKKTI